MSAARSGDFSAIFFTTACQISSAPASFGTLLTTGAFGSGSGVGSGSVSTFDSGFGFGGIDAAAF
jgi:hypothetical protein